MGYALFKAPEGVERVYSGAVVPHTGSAGALLAQYSMRLGSAVLRHRAEIAERANRVEAERAHRIKSEFINNISHELRTPLNSILGFSKILKGNGAAPLEAGQITEYAGFILDSAEGLLGVVNDVITLSKLQSGRYDVHVDAVRLEKHLAGAACWARARIEGTRKRFMESFEPDLPPVMADAGRLRNVLERLLANAIAFTPEDGRIALIAKRCAGGAIISVSDTGIGMTPEELECAFTPFGQNDTRLDRSHGGTGLGLSISKSLVELQGGRLLMRSRKGVGTDAIVILPAAVAQTREAA